MDRAREWIEFWQHHLPPDSRVVIENNSGDEISAAMIWNEVQGTTIKLKKSGCLPGNIVATTNTGVMLIRDLLAAAQCSAILYPISSRSLLEADHSSPVHMLLLQENNITQTRTIPQTSYPPDTVLLLNTSGTSTGIPIIIPLTGAGLIAQLVSHGAQFSADWERTRLSILPHHHAFGLILDLLLGIYMRQRVLCNTELARTPHALLHTLDQKKIGMVALVPRLLELLSRKLKQHPNGYTNIASLHIHVGGAPVRPHLLEELKSRLQKVTVGYGLTEAGPGVLIDGIPTGCEIKLIDPVSAHPDLLMSPLTRREGILWVRGPSLSPAVATDSEGYFCTNDLAFCIENRIEVIGRVGATIKDINGRWVPLSSIEHDLMQYPDVMGASIQADQGILKVYIITSTSAHENSKLSQFIENVLRKRTTRETQIYWQPFTPEQEADLSQASSKGLESLFP
jgi:long-subunit acyl-CoA synthetase (AMP-forming)